jgi:hypothetical protein
MVQLLRQISTKFGLIAGTLRQQLLERSTRRAKLRWKDYFKVAVKRIFSGIIT